MNELDATGKQRNTTIGVATLCSIFQIALNRAADSGELHSNLMFATCEQIDFKQVVVVALGKEFVL